MSFQRPSLQKSPDLFLVIGVTILATLAVSLGWSASVRALFMLPFVFCFPGYSFVAALFPRGELPMITRLALALPLSLAITAVGGVFLHFTTTELSPRAWLLFLASVTLVMSAVALLRRRPSETSSSKTTMHLKPIHVGMVCAATFMMFTAVYIARVGTTSRPAAGFTQLWILPAASETNPDDIRLGIENREIAPVNYQLQLRSGDTVLERWQDIQLAAGEGWEIVVPVPNAAGMQPLNALLYRNDAPTTVYRQVSLFTDTTIEPIGQVRP